MVPGVGRDRLRLRGDRRACRAAALCWHWGKFLFTEYPDEQRAAHERTVACYARGAWALDPPAERVEIPYLGTRLAAYLRVPAGERPAPAVVMIPGLDSVKEELQATAVYLLERGLATLAVDGPGQGEAEYELPIEPAYERVVAACFDWLQARGDVDAERLGVFGVSLGGYYAARAAAFEPRARATVALAGPYNFDDGFDQLPVLTRAAFQRRGDVRRRQPRPDQPRLPVPHAHGRLAGRAAGAPRLTLLRRRCSAPSPPMAPWPWPRRGLMPSDLGK